MFYSLVKFFLKFISIEKKLELADLLLGDVLKSKHYSIGDAMAERIIIKVIKSTGNKVESFIVKD